MEVRIGAVASSQKFGVGMECCRDERCSLGGAMNRTRACWENQDRVMDVDEVIARVETICRANGVKKLSLFGSFAKGTAAFTSDLDFVVYGCKDPDKLEQELEKIDTLRKIDIFEFETINNSLLLEDIRKYEKQIY